MQELLRTNDVVLLSFVQALLTEAGIGHAVVDTNMSVLEGTIGILPRRVMVVEDEWSQARRVLDEAGLDHAMPG